MTQQPALPGIRALEAEMIALRQHLHAHPELSFEEFATADLVAARLEEWGYQVHRGLGGTGVVGLLRSGDSARTIGLRADMDALPIVEQTGLAYSSRHEGVMHACGHDGHTAMLLAAAKHLASSCEFDGSLVLIFQPAEEGDGGAQRMLDDGLFERFPCDAIFAMHNMPGLPLGKLGFLPGPFMASTDTVRIRIDGVGGHGAMPHKAVDPVLVGSAIVMALQSVVSRNVDPLDTAVVTVGAFHAGLAANVIPDHADLQLSVRALKEQVRDTLIDRITQIAESQASSFGARATVEVDEAQRFPALFNHPESTEFAQQVALDWLGEDGLIPHMKPLTGSEDFAVMLQRCPGSYLLIGNGDGEGGCMVHNPGYDFNDGCLATGASYWVRLVETFLA
ncbi:M20 family metallopeptidase [Pseudomonas sp. 14P_8.1_Bac3]|uniref:M20 aminoacylase family protein n=1 Tax=Pseudomonas sp. 14P_8.1_Bac3 TaxID=2971621 RepID=UPI0021CA6496|nr:M20 aminoacylase family protein [Pseudomonas sp. 14P_8.1_Bac3]MCU1760969.1 M20 family metallopeptidase [Pseudomonas sp. 14P_8.1_Bac3]